MEWTWRQDYAYPCTYPYPCDASSFQSSTHESPTHVGAAVHYPSSDMRFVIGFLAAFAGFIGYGAYQQRQIAVAREAREAALQDSLRRVDSLEQVAAAQAAAAESAAARRAIVGAARERYLEQVRERAANRPPPLKLQREKPRVYVMKPAPTNRRP